MAMNQGSFLGLVGILAFFLQGSVMRKPLKFYVLAGQSSMQGLAHKTTFAAMGDDPKTAPMLKVEKN